MQRLRAASPNPLHMKQVYVDVARPDMRASAFVYLNLQSICPLWLSHAAHIEMRRYMCTLSNTDLLTQTALSHVHVHEHGVGANAGDTAQTRCALLISGTLQ